MTFLSFHIFINFEKGRLVFLRLGLIHLQMFGFSVILLGRSTYFILRVSFLSYIEVGCVAEV